VKNKIPFAFDPTFYTGKYADLSGFSAEVAIDHFSRYGIAEGRQGHPRGSRATFTNYISTFDKVLEIGPFCSPVARGQNVRYLDVLDEIQLRKRAKELGLDEKGCPEHIHYTGEIFDINETFDAVISSHCIEHQPDLIHHLKGIAKVLRRDGSCLLYVPDKRYCFDHYIPESTVAEVIQAHHERRTSHLLRSVIEHHALNTHNDPGRHWAGDHEVEHGKVLTERIKDAINLYNTSEKYIDVHAWYFTPRSFIDIMTTLVDCGFTELRPVECHSSLRNELEFFVAMKRE
jgi:SAM-dependent methyltransferase